MANTFLSSIPYPKSASANKHKPWIEAEYQGIVMENDNTVLLNPPLFALDKDAPLRYAGRWGTALPRVEGRDTVTLIPVLVLPLFRKQSPPNLVLEEVPSEVWRQFGRSLI